jgi:hypothetical protein
VKRVRICGENITTDYHRLFKKPDSHRENANPLLIIIANKIIQGEGWLINAISGKGRNQLWRKARSSDLSEKSKNQNSKSLFSYKSKLKFSFEINRNNKFCCVTLE